MAAIPTRGPGDVTDGAGDPVTSADAVVAACNPNVGTSPGVETRDVVLVTGPWLAGSTSLAAALRKGMPEHTFVEAGELDAAEAPAAVVFVASAASPVTESDCALLDSAAANTDLVIGVVSKIDAHRAWRDVLAADRAALAAHGPRYRDVSWMGVAAAPELGEPDLDRLVEMLQRELADPQLPRRNRLRAWETRLRAAMRRYEHDAAGAGREARTAALREQRAEALRQRRLSKSERTIALRSQIQQARVQLTYFARNRCTSVCSELQEDAATMTRRRLPTFEGYVHGRVDEVVGEVNSGVTKHLSDLATELGLTVPQGAPPPPSPQLSPPPLKSRRLQTRMIMLLGTAVGLGVALALTRLFANLAPGYTVGALIAGGVVGLAVTLWVVGIRGLLHDRAVLDRWVSDVISQLRAVVEQLVAARVSQAETSLTAEHAERDDAEAANVADSLAGIDSELREHAVAAARAAALRNRELPTLQRALDAVRAELNRPRTGAPPSQPVAVTPGANKDNPEGR